MSGRSRGLAASITRTGLHVASWYYRGAVAWRNRRFDAGRDVHHVDVPVISVGNLTTGGTGKTPVVCFLAKWFRARDVRVAILSRGYGRGDRPENDEALELHDRLPDVPHIQDPDRIAGARLAVDELETQLILLDDGFQHRRLARDLDIVLIDATCPFGYGFTLPRGLLREPVSGLSRADLVMITRVSSVSPSVVCDIEAVVRKHHPTCPIVHSDHQPTALLEYPDQEHCVDRIRGQRVAVISAIGNPIAFEASLVQLGATVVATERLADHDAFAPETVARLDGWIRNVRDTVDAVVCTHKDLVKLQTDRIGGVQLWAVRIDLLIREGEASLEECLSQVAERITPDSIFPDSVT